MNKKPFLWFIILVLLANPILGQAVNKDEVTIPYGENATAQLPMFSKTYLRVYEGSKIDFNIVDPDNYATLIENSLLVKNVGPNFVEISISSDNSDYKDVTLYFNQPYKINYIYNFTEHMTIQSLIIHYDEIRENRNTVLYFLVDSLKTSKSDFSQVKNRVVNFDSMGPGSFERSETQNSKIDKYLIALAIAIVILFLVIAIKLSQSKKLKRR